MLLYSTIRSVVYGFRLILLLPGFNSILSIDFEFKNMVAFGFVLYWWASMLEIISTLITDFPICLTLICVPFSLRGVCSTLDFDVSSVVVVQRNWKVVYLIQYL